MIDEWNIQKSNQIKYFRSYSDNYFSDRSFTNVDSNEFIVSQEANAQRIGNIILI